MHFQIWVLILGRLVLPDIRHAGFQFSQFSYSHIVISAYAAYSISCISYIMSDVAWPWLLGSHISSSLPYLNGLTGESMSHAIAFGRNCTGRLDVLSHGKAKTFIHPMPAHRPLMHSDGD